MASYPARSLEHLQVERISGDVAFNNRQRMTRCHSDDYWVVTVQLNDGLDFLLKTTDRKIPNVTAEMHTVQHKLDILEQTNAA